MESLTVQPPDAEIPTNGQGVYRPIRSLALSVAILYVAEIGSDVIGAALNAYQLSRPAAAASEATIAVAVAQTLNHWIRLDSQASVLSRFQSGVSIAAIVVFFVWVYRANRNARALGAHGMQFTPAWSVGWFFVPLANLFLPYYVVKELWKASSPRTDGQWRQAAASPLLRVWWAAWVILSCVQYSPLQAVSRHMRLADISQFGVRYADSVWWFCCGRMIYDALSIAVAALTVAVVLRITILQERHQQEDSDTAAAPPETMPGVLAGTVLTFGTTMLLALTGQQSDVCVGIGLVAAPINAVLGAIAARTGRTITRATARAALGGYFFAAILLLLMLMVKLQGQSLNDPRWAVGAFAAWAASIGISLGCLSTALAAWSQGRRLPRFQFRLSDLLWLVAMLAAILGWVQWLIA